MAKLTLTDIAAGYALVSTINANNGLIETALENTLSRDGTAPNTMGANLDMNSFDIVNVGTISATDITIDGVTLSTQVDAAAASAIAAAASEAAAAASEAAAAASESAAAASEAAAAATAAGIGTLDSLSDVAITALNKGDLVVASATEFADFAVGADGLVLTADSTADQGVAWSSVSSFPIVLDNTINPGTSEALVPDNYDTWTGTRVSWVDSTEAFTIASIGFDGNKYLLFKFDDVANDILGNQTWYRFMGTDAKMYGQAAGYYDPPGYLDIAFGSVGSDPEIHFREGYTAAGGSGGLRWYDSAGTEQYRHLVSGSTISLKALNSKNIYLGEPFGSSYTGVGIMASSSSTSGYTALGGAGTYPTQKLRTCNDGIMVSGHIGANNRHAQIVFDVNGVGYWSNTRGSVPWIGIAGSNTYYIQNDINNGTIEINAKASSVVEPILHGDPAGATTLYHNGNARFRTAASGVEFSSDGVAWSSPGTGDVSASANENITGYWSYYGDIDIRNRTIEWWDGTFNDSFGIQETGTEASLSSNTNPIKFYANTGAAGGVSLALNTSDNSSYRDFYVRNSAAPTTDYISIQHNGTDASIACGATGDLNVTGLTGSVKMGSSLKIQEQAAADTQSGGYGQYWVKNTTIVTPMFSDDTGVDHVVGYGNYVLYANSNVTLNYAFMNSAWYSDNATAYTMTLEANTSTAFEVGAQCTIWNEGSGTLTINEGTGTTLYLMDGTTVTDTAGGCTMGQGGYATLIRKSATVYLIMGAGLTA